MKNLRDQVEVAGRLLVKEPVNGLEFRELLQSHGLAFEEVLINGLTPGLQLSVIPNWVPPLPPPKTWTVKGTIFTEGYFSRQDQELLVELNEKMLTNSRGGFCRVEKQVGELTLGHGANFTIQALKTVEGWTMYLLKTKSGLGETEETFVSLLGALNARSRAEALFR